MLAPLAEEGGWRMPGRAQARMERRIRRDAGGREGRAGVFRLLSSGRMHRRVVAYAADRRHLRSEGNPDRCMRRRRRGEAQHGGAGVGRVRTAGGGGA